ncbi:PAS domain-containing protein [Bacillus safensis]|uniref:PAS domain-containing sensor histidine kinase n=1 Tax=Bacillus safensis TaxID=561879 RepID=UPI00227E6A72|nr:PAS domain-containing sensor histidine kinase [Bacillus safensis]MCY7726351.1 PAS domain-containing protein [Bacillus safensis]
MEQQMKDSNQLYSNIDLHAVLSSNGRFLYISSNCKQLLLYEQKDLLGCFLKDFVHTEDQFLVESYFYNQHMLEVCHFRLLRSDLTAVWVEASIDFVACDGLDNEVSREMILKMRVLDTKPQKAAFQEVSKVAEQSLGSLPAFQNVSEAEQLIAMLPNPLCITTLGKIVYANDAMLQLMGVSARDDMIGKSAFDFIAEEYHDIVRSRITRLQQGLPVGMIEQIWKRQDGSSIHIEVKSSPTIYQNQRAELLLLVDISSRKKFQTVLQKSRERYQLLIQNSIDTIAVIHDHKWVFMNESGIKLFEAEHYDKLIGKDIFHQIHSCDQQKVKKSLSRIIERASDSEIVTMSCHTFKHKLIYTEMVCIPTTFFGETAVQIILRDISERKQTEELMLRSEKLSIAGQLAAGIAHEIRNPLTAIKGFLQLIKPKTKDRDQYFEIVFSELSRIEIILSELLMLAKPQQTSSMQTLDLKKIISEVTALLETQANLNGILMNTSEIEEGLLMNGDQNQLKQLFINLIKNAIEAMPEGGSIYISTEKVMNEWKITIQDEGKGMSEEDIQKIYDPFFSTKTEGTGLGLTICATILKDHHGRMDVVSELGKGTTFHIYLPVCQKSRQQQGERT